ncbi:MAG: flagellar basal body rod protein FlgB [Acidobacteriota bacterium]
MTPPPNLDALQRFVQFAVTREHAISTNMANVDTPGYHTKDVDFQSVLEQTMSPQSAGWDGQASGPELQPAVREVPGLMERPDGNNVDLDRESMLMAETQLQYEVGIQLIKRDFHQILSAINGN